MKNRFMNLFCLICSPQIICFAFALFSFVPWSFPQNSGSFGSAKHNKLVIYNTDTLYFERAGFLKIAGSVPGDLWQLAKIPFKKKSRVGLAAVVAGSALLIWQDQPALNWVKKQSSSIGLRPEADYHVMLAAGKTRIIKVPRNLNTALYQLGEGGTSLMLAGGLWLAGKIKKDQRLTGTAADIAETFMTMGLTTQLLKRISGRESPFVSTANGGSWRPFPAFSTYQKHTSSYDAFPSGHLATMMATVTVLDNNFPEKRWIKPVGYSILFLSAWAMMNTEVHWAGDYPLALGIGYLSGKITSAKHKKKGTFVKSIQL